MRIQAICGKCGGGEPKEVMKITFVPRYMDEKEHKKKEKDDPMGALAELLAPSEIYLKLECSHIIRVVSSGFGQMLNISEEDIQSWWQ